MEWSNPTASGAERWEGASATCAVALRYEQTAGTAAAPAFAVAATRAASAAADAPEANEARRSARLQAVQLAMRHSAPALTEPAADAAPGASVRHFHVAVYGGYSLQRERHQEHSCVLRVTVRADARGANRSAGSAGGDGGVEEADSDALPTSRLALPRETVSASWHFPPVVGVVPPHRLAAASALLPLSAAQGGDRMVVFGGMHEDHYLNDLRVLDVASPLEVLAWNAVQVHGRTRPCVASASGG